MGYSTISWLGFIIKQKPEGIKRRIILDLRRSGGNRKAQLRKKWCCHAPRTQCRWCATTIQPATEPRCVGARRHWHSDAFMSLAVRECELPHTLAPEVQPDDFILFCALLFGYKTAPPAMVKIGSMLSKRCFKEEKRNTKYTWTMGCGCCKGRSKSATPCWLWFWHWWACLALKSRSKRAWDQRRCNG